MDKQCKNCYYREDKKDVCKLVYFELEAPQKNKCPNYLKPPPSPAPIYNNYPWNHHGALM